MRLRDKVLPPHRCLELWGGSEDGRHIHVGRHTSIAEIEIDNLTTGGHEVYHPMLCKTNGVMVYRCCPGCSGDRP
jgi:hypothetical protein